MKRATKYARTEIGYKLRWVVKAKERERTHWAVYHWHWQWFSAIRSIASWPAFRACVCAFFFVIFFRASFSFRYFLYCLDVCEWNQMNWMKASNETGCGKWTPNIHKHAHMREKENMNDKKARNNWKVKPFVMEYTIEYSRNGEKKTFNCRTEFRVDCKFCVCLRAQKNHNYFYADYHFVFLTINWSLFSLSLSLRLLLLFFVL